MTFSSALFSSQDRSAEMWLWMPFVVGIVIICFGAYILMWHPDQFKFSEFGDALFKDMFGGGLWGGGQAAVGKLCPQTGEQNV